MKLKWLILMKIAMCYYNPFGPIMPQGTGRPNITYNEKKMDEHIELENILSHLAVYDVSQYLRELNQRHISLNHFQTNYGESCFYNISGETNLLNQNQTCAPDLGYSKDDCFIYSTNNEIQNRSDVHDIDESNMLTTDTLQNSIFVHDIEQPNSSSLFNRNLIPIIPQSPSVEKPYSCRTCNMTYAGKYTLNKHLETHIEEKQFFCSECKKQLAEKEYLKHMLDHCKEKPFQCRLCDRQFAEKFNLQRHILIHTGEKPFSCSTCNKGFTQKHNFDDHIKTHTGETPYMCNVCQKELRHRSSLNRHMLTHKNRTS